VQSSLDAEADHVGWPLTNEGSVMRKLIIIAASLAALAVPTAAMADPITPAAGTAGWSWSGQ
jgi:hypothetical protein